MEKKEKGDEPHVSWIRLYQLQSLIGQKFHRIRSPRSPNPPHSLPVCFKVQSLQAAERSKVTTHHATMLHQHDNPETDRPPTQTHPVHLPWHPPRSGCIHHKLSARTKPHFARFVLTWQIARPLATRDPLSLTGASVSSTDLQRAEAPTYLRTPEKKIMDANRVPGRCVPPRAAYIQSACAVLHQQHSKNPLDSERRVSAAASQRR